MVKQRCYPLQMLMLQVQAATGAGLELCFVVEPFLQRQELWKMHGSKVSQTQLS